MSAFKNIFADVLSLNHIPQVQKYFPEPKHTDDEIDAKTLELANESEEAQKIWERFFNGEIEADQFATESDSLRDKLRGQAEDILNEPDEYYEEHA